MFQVQVTLRSNLFNVLLIQEATKCANYIPRNESGWYIWYCARKARIVYSFWKKKNVSARWGTLKLIKHANWIYRYNRWRNEPINRRDLRSSLWKRRKRLHGEKVKENEREGRPVEKILFSFVWIINKKGQEPTSTNHIALSVTWIKLNNQLARKLCFS